MPQEVEQVQTSAPVGWSGKMSPELSAPTKERTLGQSSRKQSKSQSRKSPLFLSLRTDGQQPDASPMWEENGALLGAFSMLSFGECPSAENASHLSQILEASPHPKYSLSAKACLGIVRRAEHRGKELPPLLKAALLNQAGLHSASKETASTEPTPQDATGAGRAVVIENHAKAFSFDSLASNSMKSTNPHSGCREVGVSKTLDATRPDPAKNQGGIAIVQLAVENHPQDSRVKINEDGVVQTLSGQMGTGGGGMFL